MGEVGSLSSSVEGVGMGLSFVHLVVFTRALPSSTTIAINRPGGDSRFLDKVVFDSSTDCSSSRVVPLISHMLTPPSVRAHAFISDCFGDDSSVGFVGFEFAV